MRANKPRYFERPADEDFRRANGLHVLIAGLIYFAVLLILIVILVRHISQ